MTLGRVPMTLRPALLAALLLVVARAQHRDALPAYLIDPVPAWERARALWNISAPIRPHEARAIRRHWAHGAAGLAITRELVYVKVWKAANNAIRANLRARNVAAVPDDGRERGGGGRGSELVNRRW